MSLSFSLSGLNSHFPIIRPFFTSVIVLEETVQVKLHSKGIEYRTCSYSIKQQRVFSSYCLKGNAYSRQIQSHWFQAEDRSGDRYAINTRQQLIVIERYLRTVKYTAAVRTFYASLTTSFKPFHSIASDTGQTSNSILHFFYLAESGMFG